MKTSISRYTLATVVTLFLGNPAISQVRVFMAKVGQEQLAPTSGPTTAFVAPGGCARVMIWIEDTGGGQELSSYQIMVRDTATPQGGATGSVTYRNDGMTGGISAEVIANPRWVLNALLPLPSDTYNESTSRFGYFQPGLVGLGVDVSTLGIAYMAEFVLEASAGASGDHELEFIVVPAGPLSFLFRGGGLGAGYTVNEFQPLIVTVDGSACIDFRDCADQDCPSPLVSATLTPEIRDDPCLWYACDAGVCSELDRHTPANMGGENGACFKNHDDVCDANDNFHALNCFSNKDTLGDPGYPCEMFLPSVYDVDAGSENGSCVLDGACDGNDAFAALNCFSNSTTLGLPGFPCVCGGPQPQLALPKIVSPRASTGLVLRGPESARPGDLVEVDVHLEGGLKALRGYQLHLGTGGGWRGDLELLDISVDAARRDYVFAGTPAHWGAFNRSTRQVLVGMDAPEGVPTRPGAYLATVTYRVSEDAAGTFVVDVLYDDSRPQPTARTFLFGENARSIDVHSTSPAEIIVFDRHASAGRRQ